MKSLNILILLYVVILGPQFATGQPVPESVFPMIGLNFGYGPSTTDNITALETMMNEAGLNALYASEPYIYNAMTGKTGYPSAEAELNKWFGDK